MLSQAIRCLRYRGSSKTKLYFERAFNEEPTNPLFAYWCHMALELLARAAVSKLHPALLAARRSPERTSIPFALGVKPIVDPLMLESISTSEVGQLCSEHVTGFRGTHAKIFDEARKRRNAEVHSAHPAMEALPSDWRGNLFSTVRLLATHLALDLKDLMGEQHAELVARLVAEDQEAVEREVKRLIGEAQARRGSGGTIPELPDFFPVTHTYRAPTACPACRETGEVHGEVTARRPPRVEDEKLVQTYSFLPVWFGCHTCGLQLEGNAQLSSAKIGEPLVVTEEVDPKEALDLSSYGLWDASHFDYEPEYMDE